jgi:hypothetical protein
MSRTYWTLYVVDYNGYQHILVSRASKRKKRGKGGKATWDDRRGQRGERKIDLGQEERTERRGHCCN